MHWPVIASSAISVLHLGTGATINSSNYVITWMIAESLMRALNIENECFPSKYGRVETAARVKNKEPAA